jgi:toxin FitB
VTATIAVDTSVAIPLLINKHADHAAVSRWWDGRDLALCGHALVETYSVLTRLPGELQLLPGDAALLIAERFTSPPILSVEVEGRVPEILAAAGIGGGRVYDALVALAAIEHDVELATKDGRAQATYTAVGARVAIVAPSN